MSRIDGGWLGVYQDVETGLQKPFSFVRLEDLARAAEYALNDPSVPWVPFKNYKNPKGIDHHDKKST